MNRTIEVIHPRALKNENKSVSFLNFLLLFFLNQFICTLCHQKNIYYYQLSSPFFVEFGCEIIPRFWLFLNFSYHFPQKNDNFNYTANLTEKKNVIDRLTYSPILILSAYFSFYFFNSHLLCCLTHLLLYILFILSHIMNVGGWYFVLYPIPSQCIHTFTWCLIFFIVSFYGVIPRRF